MTANEMKASATTMHEAKKAAKVMAQNFAQLSLNECFTWLTYIFRGEETVAGHIQFYVENGILLQLLKRLDELWV